MENVPALLSSLAHELRTPLSSLRMLADILAESPDGALGEPQRRNVGRLREAAGEMSRLAEDLSLFARLEGGRVEACSVGVSLPEWASDLRGGQSALAAEAGTAFGVAVEEGAAERVVVDRWLCERALAPVVRSAILSSAGGEVGVTLATVTGGDGAGGRLRVEVADSGPPLPPAGGDALFQPFAVDSPRTSGERAGSALGFAVSRGIAHLLGGEVSAADRPGSGLVVTLDVPLHGSGD